MAYTNSPLVTYTKLSPNHSGQRIHSIDRITPHCYVGQQKAADMGAWFVTQSAQCSCNYGIGRDGDVGLFVEEKNRSWCSSSSANDQRAITIECASDSAYPYAFRDAVYQKLILLCTDICKRNGKTKLIWFGDKDKTLNYSPKSDEMILTVHRWFASKECPGEWMYSRMGDLAQKVTAALGQDPGRLYTVQCGAFTKKANATALAKQIKAAEKTDRIWMGWTKRESGSAGFRQTNGDKGHAYGKYQFDYEYALVPFLQDCVAYNPERYAGLETWAKMKQSDARLVNNAFLAEQWVFYCDHYPEEFEALQDRYAYMWYYLPVKRILYEKTGINLDDRPPAVKGTLFSMSIRSGSQSAAAKVAKCTPKTSDAELLRIAYSSYGTQDANRWLMIGQYGDALEAMRSGDYSLLRTGESAGLDSIVKKTGKNYLVQCGAFSVRENAEKLVEQLKEAGFEAIIK